MLPPTKTPISLKEASTGTGPWALQRALNSLGLFGTLQEDGSFGPKTAKVVRSYQDLRHLFVDGICGPRTQADLARYLIKNIDGSLPSGLLLSILDGESGCYIAAVNWNVAGGTDCGYTQRRVLGPPFDSEEVKRAFDSHYQIALLRTQLRERFETYRTGSEVHTDERAWRLGCLHHNYPALAVKLATTPVSKLSAYYTSTQKWVTDIGAKFPTGQEIKTPMEWAQHYSLGAAEHNELGVMCRYVTDWS
jgi:hypothetical protein